MERKQSKLLLAGFALLSAGCSQIAVVSEQRPDALVATAPANQATVAEVNRALATQEKQPVEALPVFIATARDALRELKQNPSNKEALRTYNFAVARIFSVVKEAKLDPWTRPLSVGENSLFTLAGKQDPRRQWNPALYKLIPADELKVRGSYVNQRVTKEGIGAPLVAERKLTAEQAREAFSPPAIYYGVTATAEFQGSRCVLTIHDPLAVETATVAGHTYPLAADYTAPYALGLAREKPQKLGLVRLLKPEQYWETFRLARLQPYDPNKKVVLVIHGLMDTPATWVPLLNRLRADEEIRRDYQFWFFSYPSGYPYPYSAMILRQELDAIEKKYPLRKKMVVIGHSMGGCITRTLCTDTGDKLWVKAFGKTPAETEMPAESKKVLKQALILKPRPEIGTAIFMSTPHRGADMARNWIGRLGSMLVKTPMALLTMGQSIQKDLKPDPAALKLKTFPNSIDTLAPNNRFVKAINEIPMTPNVRYYTIVGDRGRGDTPKSSDGVVPYWSSHVEGAASERIVPSNHSSPLNPDAVAEVHRILKAL